MTSPDYYALLGIARDAGPAEIKRGFRVARSAAHPDRHGGSDEQAALVNRAYDCLTDPERRAIYDATGVDQPQAGEIKQLMELVLSRQAESVLREGFAQNLHIDDDRKLLKILRDGLEEAASHADRQKAEAARKVASFSKRLGRITVSPGQANLMEDVLSAKIKEAREQGEAAEHDSKVMRAALKLLKPYETKQPKAQQAAPSQRGAPLLDPFMSGFGNHWGNT